MRPAHYLPLLSGLFSSSLLAEDAPLWEVGVGVSLLSMPDYRGADQRRSHALPIPYLVYRGDVVEIDRNKARGVFYKGDRSEWDVSVSAAVPVRSNDNPARANMPNLDPAIEIGPQWNYTLRDDWIRATLRLPLRKVFAIDFPDMREIGAVFTPTLALDRANHPWPGWHASLSTGPIFGDRGYFNYYYGVDAVLATANRPAWQANTGYGGWQLTATMTKRFDRLWLGGFLRGDYLGGAAFEDSPLLGKKTSWMGGVGIAWVFAESEKRVENR